MTLWQFGAGEQMTTLVRPIGRFIGARRQIGHLAEAVLIIPVMIVFACLPVDWASRLGGSIGRSVGPRLRASGRALRNMARAMPETGDAEKRRILRAMWDNLGRAVAEYPHLEAIC